MISSVMLTSFSYLDFFFFAGFFSSAGLPGALAPITVGIAHLTL